VIGRGTCIGRCNRTSGCRSAFNAGAVERGFINYPFLAEYDPFLATLRQDPRFLRLMEMVRDRWSRFET